MSKKTKSYFLTAIVLVTTLWCQGQSSYSPYSALGVGDRSGLDMVHHFGMGGLGISNGSEFYLNNVNPALLIYNKVTVFEGAVLTESKRLSSDNLNQNNFTGGLGYLVFAFPVVRSKVHPDSSQATATQRWTTSAGLMPYSTVNYESNQLTTVPGQNREVNTSVSGSGGLSQAYFANGFGLTKNLSLGLRFIYLFGTVENETEFQVDSTNHISALKARSIYSDVTISTGLSYRIPLKNDLQANLGFTYDFGGDRDIKRQDILERRNLVGVVVSPDSLPYVVRDNERGKVTLPNEVGFGISLEKKFKWLIGVDINTANWSAYRGFGQTESSLEDSFELTLGGWFTPDLFSVGSYLKRTTYRFGINYQQTPYLVNNEQINDFGINFGVSLPVKNFSSLNLGFKYGQRGTTSNNLVREQYFQARLGFTINDNRWFIKRKFD